MIQYKPGDIVLLPFPFTDFSTFKQRPALVISSSAFNKNRDDIIVAAITSHEPEKFGEDDFLIPPNDQKESGLPKQSFVKVGKIITIDKRLVRKILGQLSDKTTKIIISKIEKIIGNK